MDPLNALNAVIDISHHNGPGLDFAKAKADGIIGVIHKASQGLTLGDAMYDANRAKATKAGLLWGAYHFGTKADGVKQADAFLAKVGDRKDVLMVLDFEPNDPSTMTLAQAHDFVTHIHEVTGRFPGLYSGHLIKKELGPNKDEVLHNCFLWLAQFGQKPVVPANWPTWTLWQYTDGKQGPKPHSVDGIGNCDRDRFNGSEAQLLKLWGVA
jgi:lysozyme